jgi:hypothetical protein
LDQFEIDVVGEDIPLWDPDAKKQEGKHSNIMEPQKDSDASMSQVISEHYSTGTHGRLPYVKYTTKRWPRYDGVFIDEERVIGILAGFSSTFMFWWN